MAYVFILLLRVPRNSCLTASSWNTSSNWNNGFGLKLKEWLLLSLKAVVLQNRTIHQLSQGSSFPTAYLGTCHPSQLCESIPHNSLSPSLPLSLLLSLSLSPPNPYTSASPPLSLWSSPYIMYIYIYLHICITYVCSVSLENTYIPLISIFPLSGNSTHINIRNPFSIQKQGPEVQDIYWRQG